MKVLFVNMFSKYRKKSLCDILDAAKAHQILPSWWSEKLLV